MYRWVDHTSELELRIEAQDERAVFTEGLAALAELLGGGEPGAPAEHQVSVGAPDRGALLIEWLNEFLFLAETEAFVPARASALTLDEHGLDATVVGARGRPRPLVKAATYHGLAFEPAGGGWRATVVLDV